MSIMIDQLVPKPIRLKLNINYDWSCCWSLRRASLKAVVVTEAPLTRSMVFSSEIF